MFNGDRVSGLQDEKVLEICFTMMGRYLTLLNYTLKNGYDIENRLVVAKGVGGWEGGTRGRDYIYKHSLFTSLKLTQPCKATMFQ